MKFVYPSLRKRRLKILKNATLLRMFKYIKPYRKYLFAIIICAIISNVLIIISPLYTGKAIDFIIAEGKVDFPSILNIIIILSVIYFLSALFQWMLSIFTNKLSNYAVRDIRHDAFYKVTALPLKYYDDSNNTHGDIINRLTNDIDFISEGLIQGLTQLFSGVITIIGALIFMFKLSTSITIVVLLITPLCFFISSFIARNSNKMFKEQSKTLGELNGYIEEIIGGHSVVKAFSYEKRSQYRFKEINQRLYKCGQKSQFYSSLTNPSTRFVNNITYILVGIIGGMAAIGGKLSIGNISSFLMYSTHFSKPINEITSMATQLQSAIASAERVFDILDETSEEEDIHKPNLNITEGNVVFDRVYFSYNKDKPLIENFKLDAKSGDTIAIVGPTGAGKTTLVNLLMRFYDVDSGSILIDGTDIQSVNKESLRHLFGMVLQESWLFSGTIRDNIAYGKVNATDSEIIKAAKSAHAHSFIKRLPNGYDTFITEDGGNLSQGQKQLLTIARVMLINPPMLILDEATSSIDTLTEARIQKAFSSLMKGKTSFIIAHRLSTIREADLILVMNNGHIIEKGTHTELIDKNGFYANLLKSQTFGE
jgi:ABC-type multidrug transport system fused ATPase/permease subunit